MGFGTGLNALVTINEYLKMIKSCFSLFHIEKYPVNNEEIVELNYAKHFTFENAQEIYQKSMN